MGLSFKPKIPLLRRVVELFILLPIKAFIIREKTTRGLIPNQTINLGGFKKIQICFNNENKLLCTSNSLCFMAQNQVCLYVAVVKAWTDESPQTEAPARRSSWNHRETQSLLREETRPL